MRPPESRYPGGEDERRPRARRREHEGDRHADVEAFFAAHREGIPEVTPDELTWRRIREEHRRRGRAARRTSVAGMAVAAAALAVGAYAVWPYFDPDPGPTAQQGGAPRPAATDPDQAGSTLQDTGPTAGTEEGTGEATEEGTAGTTAAPGPAGPLAPGELPDPVAAAPAGPGLPADLVLTSLSQDARGGMTALGSDGRAGRPLLLRAPDATGPWEVVGDLGPLVEAGAAAAGGGTATGDPEAAGALGGVAFADPETGYAWGRAGLHVTTDGGSTWQRLPLDDLLVHDVLVRGGTVHVAATGSRCQDGACAGLSLLTGPAGATELLRTPVAADGRWVTDPVLRAAGEEVYLHAPAGPAEAAPATGEPGAGSWRWQGGRAEELALPMECGGPPRALAAAPDEPGFVVTACAGELQEPLLVSASTLGGRTWGAASPQVMAPLADDRQPPHPVHLAAADTGRLVLVTGEETRTSTDGGRTWQQTPEPLPLPASEVVDVEPLTDGTLVALAVPGTAGPGGYWASTDGGRTWDRVDLVG